MHAHRTHRTRRAALVARAIERRIDRSSTLLLVITVAVILAAFLLAVAATPARAETSGSRTLTGEYPVGKATRLELGVAFGQLKVEGTDGSQVRVRVDATCRHEGRRRCEKFIDGLRLETSNRNGTLHVKLEGESFHMTWDDQGKPKHAHADKDDDFDSDVVVTVEVPRSLDFDLNMAAGEIEINGLREDVSIDLGAGQINMHMPEKHVRSVDVSMAIGETTIHQGGRTHEYARVLGGPVRWREGKGDAEIAVNIGAGEVDVTLE